MQSLGKIEDEVSISDGARDEPMRIDGALTEDALDEGAADGEEEVVDNKEGVWRESPNAVRCSSDCGELADDMASSTRLARRNVKKAITDSMSMTNFKRLHAAV